MGDRFRSKTIMNRFNSEDASHAIGVSSDGVLVHRLLDKRRWLGLLVASALGVTIALSDAPSAQGQEVWGHNGTVIIKVITGAKNYRNHTQWVSSITILAGTSAANSYGCGTFEGWTQGFYRRGKYCEAISWYISRWVSSGNAVCGAFRDIAGKWQRYVACIAIRV